MTSELQIPFDDRQLTKWIVDQPPPEQESLAILSLKHFLVQSAQPRHASGNACIKLCYFLEQCQASDSHPLRTFVFSKSTCTDLFDFYIEWNEKNQNRSMRQVLELISSLIVKNPNALLASEMRNMISSRTLSILTHQDAQPLVKPAFKCLEHFIAKGSITSHDVIQHYGKKYAMSEVTSEAEVSAAQDKDWDKLFSDLFEWMSFSDIAPSAGKFLVSMFRALKDDKDKSSTHSASWQRWISNGLAASPEALENVKNHLFPPLFKLDRAESIIFLEDLNTKAAENEAIQDSATVFPLLRLSAVETGKKLGLIEESATLECLNNAKKNAGTVAFSEDSLAPLVLHASEAVRSLAFSVLISSLSSVRPLSYAAIDILKSCMGVLYADSDAKFRNEVMSNTKHLIERLRGATSLMAKELEKLSFQISKDKLDEEHKKEQDSTRLEVQKLLDAHKDFLEWYFEFLMNELNPNASYQRHVTGLKAIVLLLQSGIDTQIPPSRRYAGNATVWPYSVHFFIPVAIRLLLDLLLDPFEDVRSTAADILRLAPQGTFQDKFVEDGLSESNISKEVSPSLGSTVPSSARAETTQAIVDIRPLHILLDFIQHAQLLSEQTGRADYADGSARALELLYSLQSVADADRGSDGRVMAKECHKSGALENVSEDEAESSERRVSSKAVEERAQVLLLDETIHPAIEPTRQQVETNEADLVLRLVANLEKKLRIAEGDLGRAVLEAPIHGDFAALRLIWESSQLSLNYSQRISGRPEVRTQLDNLQLRIVTASSRLWAAVKDILCNDSPEGHLPEDLEDAETVETKSVLSYSFRAIHESSNLLRSVVTKVRLTLPDGLPFLPLDLFEQIGDLSFDQLSNLRHRGAFSTVSSTFAMCCQLTKYEGPDPDRKLSQKLSQWYLNTLLCIEEQSSTTRRSAGMPALITGIMAARSSKVPFDDMMKDLMKIAWRPPPVSGEDPENLPQVHAMNSLKEAFKSSALGQLCEPYIGTCMQLAVHNLRSPVWALGNCSLLLLRSLIDTLFGTSVSKSEIENGWDGRSVKIQYDRYPELTSLLEKLLDCSQDSDFRNPQFVLPALDILRRAGPPAGVSLRFFPYVVEQLNNTLWHVREMAGRALCALTMEDDIESTIVKLLKAKKDRPNFRYGCLQAAHNVIERHAALDVASVSDVYEAVDEVWQLEFDSECDDHQYKQVRAFIVAAMLAVKNALLLAALQSSKVPTTISNMSDEVFELHRGRAFKAKIGNVCEQYIMQILIIAALRDDPSSMLAIIKDTTRVIDSVAALKILDVICIISKAGIDYVKVAKCFIHYYKHTAVGPQALAYLCDLLEQHYNRDCQKAGQIAELVLRLHATIDRKGISPRSHAAWTAFSGWAALFWRKEGLTTKALNEKFQNWNTLLRVMGQATATFDDRYAAARSLQYFFAHVSMDEESITMLCPVLLTLYDVLNDDDSEIREIGAVTVSRLAKKSFVDLSAARWLAHDFLLPKSGSSTSFLWHVIRRMTGAKKPSSETAFTLSSVKAQLDSAKARNNELFAIENPNLYIDETRELDLWTSVFTKLPLNVPGSITEETIHPLNALSDWVIDGITQVGHATRGGQEFHWDSNPATFILCARAISCAQALITCYQSHGVSVSHNNVVLEQKLYEILALLEMWEGAAWKQGYHPSLLARLYKRQPCKAYLQQRHELLWLVAPLVRK